MTSLTLIIDNRIFSDKISTFNVTKEITYAKVMKTLNGKEVYRNKQERAILTFSLLPYCDATAERDYEVLHKGEFVVQYTDPDTMYLKTQVMRIVSNLDRAFLLDSVNGRRYYKGENIILRAIEVE